MRKDKEIFYGDHTVPVVAVVKFNMFFKGVFLLRQGLHQRTGKNLSSLHGHFMTD